MMYHTWIILSPGFSPALYATEPVSTAFIEKFTALPFEFYRLEYNLFFIIQAVE